MAAGGSNHIPECLLLRHNRPSIKVVVVVSQRVV